MTNDPNLPPELNQALVEELKATIKMNLYQALDEYRQEHDRQMHGSPMEQEFSAILEKAAQGIDQIEARIHDKLKKHHKDLIARNLKAGLVTIQEETDQATENLKNTLTAHQEQNEKQLEKLQQDQTANQKQFKAIAESIGSIKRQPQNQSDVEELKRKLQNLIDKKILSRLNALESVVDKLAKGKAAQLPKQEPLPFDEPQKKSVNVPISPKTQLSWGDSFKELLNNPVARVLAVVVVLAILGVVAKQIWMPTPEPGPPIESIVDSQPDQPTGSNDSPQIPVKKDQFVLACAEIEQNPPGKTQVEQAFADAKAADSKWHAKLSGVQLNHTQLTALNVTRNKIWKDLKALGQDLDSKATRDKINGLEAANEKKLEVANGKGVAGKSGLGISFRGTSGYFSWVSDYLKTKHAPSADTLLCLWIQAFIDSVIDGGFGSGTRTALQNKIKANLEQAGLNHSKLGSLRQYLNSNPPKTLNPKNETVSLAIEQAFSIGTGGYHNDLDMIADSLTEQLENVPDQDYLLIEINSKARLYAKLCDGNGLTPLGQWLQSKRNQPDLKPNGTLLYLWLASKLAVPDSEDPLCIVDGKGDLVLQRLGDLANVTQIVSDIGKMAGAQ